MAHTPGPWRALPEHGRIVLNGSAIYGVADIAGDYATWNPADLTLMAAAPEMISVLQDLCGYEDVIEEWDNELHARMRAVLAKAEGREA